MEISYFDKLRLLVKTAQEYSTLELSAFIQKCLMDSGFDVQMMNNVYIEEDVNFPNVYGCYKKQDLYISYVTNEKCEKLIREHENAGDFMLGFVRTAPNSTRYNEYTNVHMECDSF